MLRLLEGHEYGGQVRRCLKYLVIIVTNIKQILFEIVCRYLVNIVVNIVQILSTFWYGGP